MLKALKFVQGAVSKKDLVPALTHFRIENGTVRSYNGMLALCTPIALNIDCTPKAETLVKAIGHCDETVTMSITPTGRLSVRSGSFKALVDCVQEETPHVLPEGDECQIDGAALVDALKLMYPFIGDDASRPWSNGILLKGQSAFATNNVTLIECWIGTPFPRICNIPRACIKEMIRIGEPPTKAQFSDNSVTFHYEGDRWIRSQLFATDWPDLGKVLDVQPGNMVAVDDRIFAGLEKLKPFVDKYGRIFFKGEHLCTTLELEDGCDYKVDGMQLDGVYNVEMLQILKGVATQIDFGAYPKPCLFYGNKLRGAIIGMRLN